MQLAVMIGSLGLNNNMFSEWSSIEREASEFMQMAGDAVVVSHMQLIICPRTRAYTHIYIYIYILIYTYEYRYKHSRTDTCAHMDDFTITPRRDPQPFLLYISSMHKLFHNFSVAPCFLDVVMEAIMHCLCMFVITTNIIMHLCQ